MTVGAIGVQTLWGTGVESAWGTAVAVDRHFEILPSESIKRSNRVLTRQGMRGGTIPGYTESRRVNTGQSVAGSVSLEVLPISMGRLFKQLMGTAPTLTQVGVTPAWSHLYPLGPLGGDSLTIQKVLKDPDGTTVSTLTQAGCKFTSGEFALTPDQFLNLTLEVDGKSEVNDVAAAAAAYASATVDPYHFAQATLTVGGVAAANVSATTVKIERALKVDRYYIGNQGTKDEQVEEGRPKITGSLTVDVINETLYNLFRADGGGTLVWQFIGGAVTGAPASNNTLTITVPLIHLTDGTPTVSTPGLITGQLPFESDAGAATITYLTSDTAA